jgi:argininosuccinate lyase
VAEPITFGHFAAAHAWAIVRDRERLRDARRRVDVLPLGSGALAGTALPLAREALARDLGFAAVSENALDAVSDRDFAAEFVFACAQAQTHLSRLAEDLIWFGTPEHGFWSLPEAFTTGSSLMPHKKNPDAAELVRGKAARVLGSVVRLLAMMKSLPTGYQKDLQEDKEAVFDAADTVASSLTVMTGVVSGLVLEPDAMRRGVGPELMAASLAVAIAREGTPFRAAHTLVGSLVAESQKSGRALRDVAAERLASASPGVAARIDTLLDPAAAVRAKAARGGTAPEAVRESLEAAVARVSEP